jgi:hypothetical protein
MGNNDNTLTEAEWIKRNVPKGCDDSERWNLGCVGCVEWFNAYDEDEPCKRSSPQDQNVSPTAE